ncbi:MAG: pantoate--beta-alanine ligase, partial [Micrococcales bacterium]
MRVVTPRAELASARADFGAIALVPTMGFLHEGHLSLVRLAKADHGAVAVSIFVNPTQFGPTEDLASYPRDLDRDLELLAEAGADLVWTPGVSDIYPPEFSTYVDVEGVTDVLEGARRPGHFRGVATVVSILFHAVRPTAAYFGQKDAQQCVVLRKMVTDLAMGIDLIVAPTVREPDGLAMSSRNNYLDAEHRAAATVLIRALRAAEQAWAAGEADADALRKRMTDILDAEPLAAVDYVSVADP